NVRCTLADSHWVRKVYAHTHTHTHIHTYIHTYRKCCAYIHTCTHAHTHTHTHTLIENTADLRLRQVVWTQHLQNRERDHRDQCVGTPEGSSKTFYPHC